MTEKRDEPGPEKPAGERPAAPKLEFKADPRQAVRLARIRTFTLGAITVLLLLATIWVLSYRPPVAPPPGFMSDKVRAEIGETLRFSSESSDVPRAVVPANPVDLALEQIDSAVRRAADRWLRAEEFVPQTGLDSSGATAAAALLRRAAVMADSARADVAAAQSSAEVIRNESRTRPSGDAYRLSVVYAAAREYLRYVGQDADDRSRYYQTFAEAVSLLAQGDAAGFEVKQNVANSYRRDWEQRERGTRQRAAGLEEAVRGLGGRTR